jgi:hypothetical protein
MLRVQAADAAVADGFAMALAVGAAGALAVDGDADVAG